MADGIYYPISDFFGHLFCLGGSIFVIVGGPVDGIAGIDIKRVEEAAGILKFFDTRVFLPADLQ